jgi:hypothetical protein
MDSDFGAPLHTAAQEAAFDAKVEKSFRSQRELKNGRDYRWNCFCHITDDERKSYRKNFDNIFPKAPGAGV